MHKINSFNGWKKFFSARSCHNRGLKMDSTMCSKNHEHTNPFVLWAAGDCEMPAGQAYSYWTGSWDLSVLAEEPVEALSPALQSSNLLRLKKCLSGKNTLNPEPNEPLHLMAKGTYPKSAAINSRHKLQAIYILFHANDRKIRRQTSGKLDAKSVRNLVVKIDYLHENSWET